MKVHEITDQNFEVEVLKAELPVIVDFWAQWCAPCLRLGPIIDELAKDHRDTLKVTKLNVDENQETPRSFGVQGIPTIIFFKKGKEAKRIVGAREKTELEKELGLNGALEV
ncbi:MAG: thioredoxin [Actinomycetota bacterium]|nr:thioredoxin [Actinomycetota bacterium]